MTFKSSFKYKIPFNVKMLSVLAGFVFLLSILAGCKTLPDNMEDIQNPSTVESGSTQAARAKPANEVFSLGYSVDDKLNPYTLATEYNYRLSTLLYDGLVALDENLSPVMLIAESVERTGKVFTVNLKATAKFSDGRAIKAEDVIYSYNLAKGSKYYLPSLKNVVSAQLESERVLKFSINRAEPNEKAIFTFPIIPKDSGDTPASSGRYAFSGGEAPKLVMNTSLAHRSFDPKIKTINLVNLADGDAVLVALASGEISFNYNDLASGEIIHTGVPHVNSPQNSMIFLGINSAKSELSSDKVRSALAHGISRQEVSSGAFAGRALPATLPFYANWAGSANLTGFSANENIAVSVAQLSEAGYNSDSTLKLEVLVPEGNSFKLAAADVLKNQLIKSHVTVTVTALPFAEYEARLKNGNFQLYIGEILLPPTLSLDAFLTAGGSAAYGVNMGGEAAKAYADMDVETAVDDGSANGPGTIGGFIGAFTTDVPFIPLCYKFGQASFIRQVSGANPLAFDPFFNFESWNFKLES